MPQIYTYSQAIMMFAMAFVILGVVGAVMITEGRKLAGAVVIVIVIFLAMIYGSAEMYIVEQNLAVSRDATAGLVRAVRDDPRLLAPARRAMADGRLTHAEYRALQRIETRLEREDLRALQGNDAQKRARTSEGGAA